MFGICDVANCGGITAQSYTPTGTTDHAIEVCELHDVAVSLAMASIRAGETIRYPVPGTDGYRFLRIRVLASDPKPETVEFGTFSGAERIQFPPPMPHDPETTDWASWLC